MSLFVVFMVAFFATALGCLLPGMLNMAAVNQSLHKGLAEGKKYAIGAALPFAIHAGVALVFAGFLTKHPEIFDQIRQSAIFIFLLLALVFYWQATHPKPIKSTNRKGAALFLGFVLGCANALVIPYFFIISSWLVRNGWMQLSTNAIVIFVLGAVLGALLMFLAYAYLAQAINKRVAFFAKNSNYFLAGLFAFLALIQLAQVSS